MAFPVQKVQPSLAPECSSSINFELTAACVLSKSPTYGEGNGGCVILIQTEDFVVAFALCNPIKLFFSIGGGRIPLGGNPRVPCLE